jgi:hypothetical protein
VFGLETAGKLTVSLYVLLTTLLVVRACVSIALWRGARAARLRRIWLACGLALLGVMVLPFRVGGYTYVNLRLAVLAYFFLAWAAGSLDFPRWTRHVLVSAVGGLLLLSLVKQALVSREIEAIGPLLARMPPNMRVLPRKVLRFLPDPGRARGFRELARSACRHRRAFGPLATDAPALTSHCLWPPVKCSDDLLGRFFFGRLASALGLLLRVHRLPAPGRRRRALGGFRLVLGFRELHPHVGVVTGCGVLDHRRGWCLLGRGTRRARTVGWA